MLEQYRGLDSGSARLPRDYITALEVEVDRLRRDNRLVHELVQSALVRLRDECVARERVPRERASPDAASPDGASGDGAPHGDGGAVVTTLGTAVQQVIDVLRELRDLPGYHPAFDQVVAVAVRPLAEQIFRRHHRLLGLPRVSLRLALESEHIDWFPARLRIILDNLLCNALKYRDASKEESWVQVGLVTAADGYEFCISDNGVGLPASQHDRAFNLQHRVTRGRAAGTGVGLSVVKALVEQSGGALDVDAGEGQGTTVRFMLPRYEIDDFLV